MKGQFLIHSLDGEDRQVRKDMETVRKPLIPNKSKNGKS